MYDIIAIVLNEKSAKIKAQTQRVLAKLVHMEHVSIQKCLTTCTNMNNVLPCKTSSLPSRCQRSINSQLTSFALSKTIVYSYTINQMSHKCKRG